MTAPPDRVSALRASGATVLRRPSPYQTSHALEEVDVACPDGSSLALIHKDLRREALHEAARLAKPAFLHDPCREIEVYELLSTAGLGTPYLFDHGDDWIVIERVAGLQLNHAPAIGDWQRAAAWLGRLHQAYAERPPRSTHLVSYDASFFAMWPERARALAGPELDGIVSRYGAVVERLAALPATLIHGEFFASNVIITDDRVAPIDWEMAGIGPGLIDLAALTTGTWNESERAEIASAYGAVDDEALECCHLHLSLQWLGWSSSWVRPAEHAHDWLGEALRAAGRLGL
jgi:aminoglycoside phosphotransferase